MLASAAAPMKVLALLKKLRSADAQRAPRRTHERISSRAEKKKHP